MSVAELKTDLIRYIIDLDDPKLLENAMRYFQSLHNQQDWWDTLTEAQQDFVLESSKQYEEGKIVSNEEVRSKVKEIILRKSGKK